MENNMYLVVGVMMCMFPAMIHDAACVLIARARSSSVTATSCKYYGMYQQQHDSFL